jgi:hypothetical protein
VAPGASRGKLLVVYAAAAAGTALAVALAVDTGLPVVVPGFGWTAAAAVYGLVVAGAVVVLAAPPELRRPVAFAATTLAWFAPVLLIKLLLGHLLPGEAALRGGV